MSVMTGSRNRDGNPKCVWTISWVWTVWLTGEGDKINLSDLIGTLDKTPSALIKTKKQLKNLQHNQSTMETPLTRKETEKVRPPTEAGCLVLNAGHCSQLRGLNKYSCTDPKRSGFWENVERGVSLAECGPTEPEGRTAGIPTEPGALWPQTHRAGGGWMEGGCKKILSIFLFV